MADKKVSSGGSFGGKAPKSKPAAPSKPVAADKPATPGKPAAPSSKPAGASTPATTSKNAVKPRPARAVDPNKQRLMEQKRTLLREKQNAWQATQKLGAQKAAASLDEAMVTRLNSCQTNFDDLQDDILLVSVHDDMGRMAGELASLATDLEAVRSQGYVFQSFLENKITVLADKWEAASDTLDDDIQQQGEALAREAESVRRTLQQAIGGNAAMVARAESGVQTLDRKSSAARTALQGRYQDIRQNVQQTRAQLDRIRWAVEQAAQAKFDWLEAEYLVAACKAGLLEGPEDGDAEEGTLFLTDERLIFEQKEKKATKKFLFVTTASEMVQEVLLAEPLGHIERLEAVDARKFLSTRELLTVHFSSSARVPSVTFHVQDGAKNEEWVTLLNRVRSGEIERERLAAVAEEKEARSEQLAQAPTVCGTCGATFPATAIVRGQSTLTCEYCGAVTRL